MDKKNVWLLLSAAVALATAIVGASVVGASVAATQILGAPKDDAPTCWTDPDPHQHLDFDFHTFAGGRPVRCGYREPNPDSVLPRVLGEEERAVYSDIMCYSMKAVPCTEAEWR